MLTATISGSFHRHLDAIAAAVKQLSAHEVRVLSPADPRIVERQNDYFYVASDEFRSVRLVQDRHLDSIRASDFLWLVTPDGYVGQSASMELGYAAGAGVPIFSTFAPLDLTLRQYVRTVSSLAEALRRIRSTGTHKISDGLLINPHDSIERAHKSLERIESALTCRRCTFPTEELQNHITSVYADLSLPTRMQ